MFPFRVCRSLDISDSELIPGEGELRLLPEHYLLIEILLQAVTDACHVGYRQYRNQGQFWFRDKSTAPMSFLWIVDILKLSPCIVRRVKTFVVRNEGRVTGCSRSGITLLLPH